MNRRKKKKYRQKIYRAAIENVTLEISIDPDWRHKIFALPFGERLEISYLTPDNLPPYVRNEIMRGRLEFYVSRVLLCKEPFDEGLTIFKFESKEYPNIIRFSGNNPDVL